MANIFLKKILAQVALNPLLHGTSKARAGSRIHPYCLLLPSIFLPAMLSQDAIFIDDTRKLKLTEKKFLLTK